MSDTTLLAVIGIISTMTVSVCGACAALWMQLKSLTVKYDALQGQHKACEVAQAKQNGEIKLIRAELINLKMASVSGSQNAYVTTDEKGSVIYWSLAASDMFGYSREEAVGMNVTRLIPERFQRKHNTAIKQLRDGHQREMSHTIDEGFGVRKDSTEFPCVIKLTGLREQRNEHLEWSFRADVFPRRDSSET